MRDVFRPPVVEPVQPALIEHHMDLQRRRLFEVASDVRDPLAHHPVEAIGEKRGRVAVVVVIGIEACRKVGEVRHGDRSVSGIANHVENSGEALQRVSCTRCELSVRPDETAR